MWLLLAFIGALATSFTTICAKIGIKKVNSNFATVYRTFIVAICCLIFCVITKHISLISTLSMKNVIYLIISGLFTGCSWLCYYRAIKLGDINKVAPIDKSSFILTNILFLIFFFEETSKGGKIEIIIMLIISICLMFVGTLLMVDYKKKIHNESLKWLIYALLSMLFASLVQVFVKIGLENVPSDLGTFIRTIVVFVFSLIIVLIKKDYSNIGEINKKSWIFLTISGIATGVAWLAEYYALNMKSANAIVVTSIGKLSILFTMAFSFLILKEKFSKKALIGLSFLTFGIIIAIIFSL